MAGNANVAGRSVASKVAAILRCFDGRTHETLSALARRTGLPLSTTYRLVTELVAAGVMVRTANGLYTLFDRSVAAGAPPGCPYSALRDAALPVMDDLFFVTRRTTRLGTVRSGQLDYIERSAGRAMASAFGEEPPLPLHATALGKAVLAYASPQLVNDVAADGLPAWTPRTTTSVNRLRAGLITVRRAGMAVNWGELDATSGIAVAVFGAAGQLVGALGLEINGQTEMTRCESALRVAGRALSRRLASAGPGAFAAPDAVHTCARCAGAAVTGSGPAVVGPLGRWAARPAGPTPALTVAADRS